MRIPECNHNVAVNGLKQLMPVNPKSALKPKINQYINTGKA